MGFFFAWDPNKAHANEQNHGITFEEASTVFGDTLSLTIYDTEHSDTEDRLIIIGLSLQHRLLVVAHTDRGETIRIISARRATAYERKTYERNAAQYD
ncbi:MAG TPA: BrnT family toxin [Roseiflexaceae bacterium]|nr:BrnT family toxin [Roseiflexaceae bacterium]